MLALALLSIAAVIGVLLYLLFLEVSYQKKPQPIRLKSYEQRRPSAASALLQDKSPGWQTSPSRSQKRYPLDLPTTGKLEDARRVVKAYRTAQKEKLRTTAIPKRYPKLERLLNGNSAAAARLVAAVKSANPDKSDQWCYEKALFDLERDRH